MPGLSINPDAYQEGGLWDNENVRVAKSRYTIWNYDNKGPDRITLTLTCINDEGTERMIHWVGGDPKMMQPTPDGLEVESISPTQKGFNKSSNMAFAIGELVRAGFPKDRLTSRADCLEGLYGFVMRAPAPERPGLATDRERALTVPVFTKIHRFPWEQEASQPQAEPRGSSTPKPPALNLLDDTEVVGAAIKVVRDVLAAKDGKARITVLAGRVMSDLGDHPRIGDIAALVQSDEFRTYLEEAEIAKMEGRDLVAM